MLTLADSTGRAVPFQFIANDGNLLVNPITLTSLPVQASGERYDIVVDFSRFRIGDKVWVVNRQKMRDDGRGPDDALSLSQAMRGDSPRPAIGPILEFRVVDQVASVDVPGVTLRASDADQSVVPAVLTEQIPVVPPVRTRVFEVGRSGGGDSRGPNGQCTPDCPEEAHSPGRFGERTGAHTFNANRISVLVPKPGEIEHWTVVNAGGGWDHPCICISRKASPSIADARPRSHSGNRAAGAEGRMEVGNTGDRSVTFQVQFGEYGGSYVQHCHNNMHEDFAMLCACSF